MKKEITEELLVKLADGLISPDEQTQLDALMAEDPALAGDLADMKSLSATLKSAVPASVEPPYGDFFNSQLMRKVDLEVKSQRPAKKAERWWQSLRWAWAPAGALALALSFLAGHRASTPLDAQASSDAAKAEASAALPTVYFAAETLEANVIANADGEVAAIIVNGLSAVRDDLDAVNVSTKDDELPSTYEKAEATRFQ